MAKTDRSQAATFTKTKLAAAVAAASGLAVPVPVAAQESPGASPAIEEVIVTARKREANIQDTPVSIQAFTADDLDRLDLDRFEDFADQSPSISYVSAGPGTQLMHIRGVSDGGIPHVFRTNDATTSFYLDEQPVNGRSGGAPDLHLYDIERIEVLRGPEGTYYGASSVSGTVRIITNKPDPEARSYGLDLSGGSIAHGDTAYTAEAFANLPLSDRAAVRGVFWHDKSNGFVDNLHTDFTYTNGVTVNNRRWAGEDYNEEETTGARGSLLVDLNDSWQIVASAMTQTTDTVGAWDHDPTRRGDLEVVRRGPEYTNLDFSQLAFTLTGETDIGDLVYATSYFERDDLAVNDYSDYVEYASFGSWIQQHACENYYWYGFSGCADPSIFFESEANASRWSHELRFATTGEGRLNWIAGAYYEQGRYDGYLFWEMPGINFANGPAGFYSDGAGVTPLPLEWWSCPGWKGTNSYAAAFGDVSWDFTDRLTGAIGMRVFRADDGEGSGWSCGYPWEEKVYNADQEGESDTDQTLKASIQYDVSADLLVYASYGEGFRRGGRNPNVTHDEVPEFYESDFTNSYEVGWKATLADGRLVVNGAAYHIAWDNFQTVLYDLLTVPFNFRRNVEGATVTGLEVDMIARLNENWFLTGGLARNNAELVGDFATIAREPRFVYAEQGRRLAHTPEWSAALGLRYDQTLATGTNIYGQFNWSFTDERWNLLARQSEQPPVVMDAYSLVHLRAGADFRDGAWGLEAYVTNATDERAQIFQNSGYYDSRITTNQPRTIGLRLKVRSR
ncbi:MAG: TonB-dependent receptor [Gammaproteobacteria bacterium]|nr:TonB-dependent receptor [Gammaproteobacteria bacterium]